MFTAVSLLSPNSEDPLLCVRLRRAWTTLGPDLLIQSVELLLVDKDGDTIQASVSKMLYPKFEGLFLEGNIYHLRAFNVVEKSKSNEMTATPYMLIFVDETLISITDDSSFNESFFLFKTFPDIIGYFTFCGGPLFDVIGSVVDFDDRLDSDGCMKFMLQDLENNRLVCRLSNPYVKKLGEYPQLCKSGRCKFFVVILQLCNKDLFKDEVCVSAQAPITDVICNPFLDEIKSYYARFNLKGVRLCFDGAKFLSPLLKSGRKELGGPGRDVYSINHLSYFEEVLNLWTIGTVTNIRSDLGWYSVHCSRCSSEFCGVYFDVFCRKCGQNLTYAANFRVFLDVVDEKGAKGCFIIENEVASFLIESKVSSLIRMYSHISPIRDITKSAGHLIGRELLFKVSLSEQRNVPSGVAVYDVLNCCVCPFLLQHYKEKMSNNLEPMGAFDGTPSDSDPDYLESDYLDSSDEVSD